MIPENPRPISVIMVSYHTGPCLFQAVQAVLDQNVPLELCLVDNGNPPEVVAKLHALAAEEKRLRFITGYENVGFSRGCNTGARVAQNPYLLFLNPDSLLPAGALEKLMQTYGELPAHVMCGARLLTADGHDQRGCRRALLTPMTALVEALHLGRLFPHLRLNYNKEPIPATVTVIPAISGAFMFLSREDFWKIGGFDEGYFLHVEDLDLCLRFRRAGGEIYFIPDLKVTHLGGTSDASSFFIEKNKTRGFMRYFHRNFSKQYPLPLLWILDLAILLRAALKVGGSLVRFRSTSDHNQ